MQTQRLLHRIDMLWAAPCLQELSWDEQEALRGRLIAASDVADLSEADRKLLRRGALEVSSGKSPAFQNSADWGNWAMIDAAIDSEDVEALEVALDTVGRGYGYFPGAPQNPDAVGVEAELVVEDGEDYFDEDDEDAGEVKADPPAGDDWVGL